MDAIAQDRRLDPPRTWLVSQSQYFDALWLLDGVVVQVDIRVNAYQDQSHARLNVFDPVKRSWRLLVSLPSPAMKSFQKTSYVQPVATAATYADDEQELLRLGHLILGGQPARS